MTLYLHVPLRMCQGRWTDISAHVHLLANRCRTYAKRNSKSTNAPFKQSVKEHLRRIRLFSCCLQLRHSLQASF